MSDTARVDHLCREPRVGETDLLLHDGDVTDATTLVRLPQEVQPDEIYHLAAQSRAQASFETSEYAADTNAIGTLRLLEAIRIVGLGDRTRFCRASTSPRCSPTAPLRT